MRGPFILAALLVACSNGAPPPIADSDAALSQFTDDAYRPPVVIDASADAGALEELDFEGVCTPGEAPIWHFFDFETHTPGDSSLHMSVQTADTEAQLDGAPSVVLADVSGPDITTWTGVDVTPKLQSIGEPSRLFLRVTVESIPATDGGAPQLAHYRQQYDCVVGQ